MTSLKAMLKAVRASQPFNVAATTLVKAAFGIAGPAPELVVQHLHRVGSVRVRLPNGRWLCLWSLGDDWVSNRVYWRGWKGYDPETVPVFFRLAERAQAIFDVGAYVGFYTLLAAHANPQARVYAFEPLPTVYERLTHNVALNQLPKVHCHLTAVGEESGLADFYHAAARLPTSSSLSFEFMKETTDLQRSTVPVIRLDQFAEEHQIGRVDLMKIDTESTEPQVLRGMRRILERDRPQIICEVLSGRDTGPALEELLGPLGYRYYLLTSGGPRRTDKIVGQPEWFNYLFTTLSAEEISGITSTQAAMPVPHLPKESPRLE